MADELGMRIVLQDEGPEGGEVPVGSTAAPASPATPVEPAQVDVGADPLREQFDALHAQVAAATEQLEALQAAAGGAAEAMPEEPAEDPSGRDPRDQKKFNDAAATAMHRATSGIVDAFRDSLPFGQIISVLQGVARPIMDAMDALEAQHAAAGGSPAVEALPVPATPNGDGGGGVPPVAVPPGALAAGSPMLLVAAGAAAAAVGLYAAAKAASAVDRRLQETAERLAPLNAELAVAQARAGVEGLRQDIRSARTLGPELAEFTASRASVNRSLQRIEDILSKFALEKINPVLERIADLMEKVSENGPALELAIDAAFRTAFPLLTAALDIQKAISGQMQQAANKASLKDGDLFTIFEDIPDLAFGDNALTMPFQTVPVSFDASGGLQLP